MKFFQGDRCNATLGGRCSILLSYWRIWNFAVFSMVSGVLRSTGDRRFYLMERISYREMTPDTGVRKQAEIDSVLFWPENTRRKVHLPLRRRVLYPTELLRHFYDLFNFHCSKESNNLPLRRQPLYPTELRDRLCCQRQQNLLYHS